MEPQSEDDHRIVLRIKDEPAVRGASRHRTAISQPIIPDYDYGKEDRNCSKCNKEDDHSHDFAYRSKAERFIERNRRVIESGAIFQKPSRCGNSDILAGILAETPIYIFFYDLN